MKFGLETKHKIKPKTKVMKKICGKIFCFLFFEKFKAIFTIKRWKKHLHKLLLLFTFRNCFLQRSRPKLNLASYIKKKIVDLSEKNLTELYNFLRCIYRNRISYLMFQINYLPSVFSNVQLKDLHCKFVISVIMYHLKQPLSFSNFNDVPALLCINF